VTTARPVEKLHPETGELLETYVSLAAAARAVGSTEARIRTVIQGKSVKHGTRIFVPKTAKGFKWRWENPKAHS
jgi:hypothetical protein